MRDYVICGTVLPGWVDRSVKALCSFPLRRRYPSTTSWSESPWTSGGSGYVSPNILRARIRGDAAAILSGEIKSNRGRWNSDRCVTQSVLNIKTPLLVNSNGGEGRNCAWVQCGAKEIKCMWNVHQFCKKPWPCRSITLWLWCIFHLYSLNFSKFSATCEIYSLNTSNENIVF